MLRLARTITPPNGALEIYKPDNSLLATIGGHCMPLGVCLDQSGCIYVAEGDTLKIKYVIIIVFLQKHVYLYSKLYL